MVSELLSLPLFIDLRLPYQLRWEYVFDHKDWFIDGLILALRMSFVALLFGCVIGLVCAFARSSGNRILSVVVTGYVELIRNIPLLLLVFVGMTAGTRVRHARRRDQIMIARVTIRAVQ